MNTKMNCNGALTQGVKAFIYSGLVVLALACSSSERRVDDVVVSPSPSENPTDEIQKLKAEVDDARANQVDLLSPTWFASADRSLQASKKIQNEGGDYRQLFKRSAEGRMQIQRANEISKTSQKIVADVMKAREESRNSQRAAMDSGATNLEEIRTAMADADEKLISITKSIENNELDNMVDRRQDAIKAYAAVQSNALRKGKLDTAKRVVQEAIRQGAKKHAPKSLAYADEVINSTEELIRTNPRATDDINRKSDESLFFARRALLFTQEARDIAKRNPEDTVLWVEQTIQGVAEEAGAADMRDEKFDNQIASLKSKVADLKSSAAAAAVRSTSAYPPVAPKKAVKKAAKRAAPQKTGSTVITPRPGDRVTVTVEPENRQHQLKDRKSGSTKKGM